MNELKELQDSIRDRLDKMEKLLETTTEKELNTQPLLNKRTPAEIFLHIIRVDSAPLWFWRLFYGGVNIFNGLYDKITDKPIRRTAERWDLDKGGSRVPSEISKDKLLDKFDKVRSKVRRRAEQMQSQHYNTIKVMERHCWMHLFQVEKLLSMVTV